MSEKKKRRSPRKRQNWGFAIGALAFIGTLVVLLLPGRESLHAYGPANTGHESLECADCHDDAVGSPIQQINANIRYMFGARSAPVDFVHQDVDNAVCQDCHERPNDRHPVYRFEEPRFADAQEAIAPQYCTSCHIEHTGVRVNIEPTYCINCHADIKVKNDPIDVPHDVLAADEAWDTCLQCHDFHGNHIFEVPVMMEERFPLSVIDSYFEGGESPYGESDVQANEERTPESKE